MRGLPANLFDQRPFTKGFAASAGDEEGGEEVGGLFGPNNPQSQLDPFMVAKLQEMVNRQRQIHQPMSGLFQNGQGSADFLSGQPNQSKLFNFR